jgi:uncharacterized membrane protein YphA (DoxX/SURF4 family)
MKIVALIARLLLGLMFLVFGLNGFLHFIPMDKSQMPQGLAGQYTQALMDSHYMLAISAVEVVSGALLLVGRFVPLALTLLGPVLVNILLYHIFLDTRAFQPGVFATLLWFLIFWRHREAFAGIFNAKG